MRARRGSATAALSARIEFVCTAHPHPGELGPRFTVPDGAWVYCAGCRDDAHEWTRIEPTRPGFIGVVDAATAARTA